METTTLKSAYTNPLYQSKFMPIIEKAETRIKQLIFAAFLFARSRYFLLLSIAQIIADVDKKIPQDLRDRDQYLRALQIKGQYFVYKYYDLPQNRFNKVKNAIESSFKPGDRVPQLNNPKQVVDLIQDKKMWSEAKGLPNVINYPKEVKLKAHELAAEPITTQESGKQPISLWQKAELDVRYENQMQKLQDLRVEGVELAWLSSHPNASKRCSVWQGELVALNKHATSPQTTVNPKTFNYKKSSFLVDRVDGHRVYSLPDIMDVVDSKYGYHNNIICGFNCRHRLIPYKPGSAAPKEYTEAELKREREIESKIREMERAIRLKKRDLILYNNLGNKAAIKALKEQIKNMVAHYKAFCEKYGYAYYLYRIEVI